jgi:hypothetical protein
MMMCLPLPVVHSAASGSSIGGNSWPTEHSSCNIPITHAVCWTYWGELYKQHLLLLLLVVWFLGCRYITCLCLGLPWSDCLTTHWCINCVKVHETGHRSAAQQSGVTYYGSRDYHILLG